MTDISPEDKALFRRHVQTVEPLEKDNPIIQRPQKASSHHAQQKYAAVLLRKKDYFLSDYISNTVHSHTVLSYTKPGVSDKHLKELQRGLISFDAKLDLHGFKIEAAREALCDFIQIQSAINKRCVLIIHGKGGHEGAPPLIKNHINRWLPQFDEILAFHSALPKHGGQGAVYVLLKRSHSEDYFSE